MNSAWTGENANEKRLVEVADKTLEKLQDFFRDRFTSVNPATIYDATIQALPHMATIAYVVEDKNKIPY